MASRTSDALKILPVDVAEDMKACAAAAGKSTANVRGGTKGEADAQKVYWGEHAEHFTKKAKMLLSKEICDDIKQMFWYQAWRTANERKRYMSDVESDMKKVQEIYESIKSRGEMDDALVDNIQGMGFHSAWFEANTVWDYTDDTKRDKANREAHYNKMHGEIKFIGMNFFTDDAKTLTQKPKVIGQQTLPNNTDIMQKMSFSFSSSQGSTTSISATAGFKYTASTSVTAGFNNVFIGKAEATVGASFEISASATISGSLSQSETKSYTFYLDVPAHTTYTAKGMVNEAEMEIPYELVFDFDGSKRSVNGTWTGVAVSTVTYEVNKA